MDVDNWTVDGVTYAPVPVDTATLESACAGCAGKGNYDLCRRLPDCCLEEHDYIWVPK